MYPLLAFPPCSSPQVYPGPQRPLLSGVCQITLLLYQQYGRSGIVGLDERNSKNPGHKGVFFLHYPSKQMQKITTKGFHSHNSIGHFLSDQIVIINMI